MSGWAQEGVMVPLGPWASVPPWWASAGIVDARAFTIGNSDTIHRPTHVRPMQVRAACGAVAYVGDVGTRRLAYWSAGMPDCPSCGANR